MSKKKLHRVFRAEWLVFAVYLRQQAVLAFPPFSGFGIHPRQKLRNSSAFWPGMGPCADLLHLAKALSRG